MHYKIFTWVDIVACALAVALLIFMFICPYKLAKSYYDSFSKAGKEMLALTKAESWAEASERMDIIVAEFYSMRGRMCFFYDHEDIDELEGCILSARELIMREDGSQSVSELIRALVIADYLFGIQKLDLPNLF